jgi:serine/threonine-protein kinase
MADTQDTVTLHGHSGATSTPLPARYGRYRLGAVLGRGGMGEVVSADDDAIGRTVAIKRMHGEPTPEAIARFAREARIQGQLEHPAIVPVHELGSDDAGRPVIVMKQLRGRTLHDIVRAGSLSRPKLLRAFVDVCLAIELAHSRGVIHRDLKPSNIVLGDFGEVYVLDWGIAHVRGEVPVAATPVAVEAGGTVAGAILGTPGYMSPEQLHGADLDGRADVYALGCILFEILAGEPLDKPSLLPARVLGTADAEPSRRGCDAPPELDAACRKATMPDRADRYASARAMADVVEGVLDGDRDVAQRKKLAAELLARANDALARGDGAPDRADAMAAAGRALALDPTSGETAALVGRLMLEPPKQTPPEVEAELDADELGAITANHGAARVTVLAFFVLLPVIWWAGIHVWWFYAVGAACALFMVATRARINDTTGIRRPYAIAWVAAALGAVVVAALAQSPLFALPTGLSAAARLSGYRRLVPSSLLVAFTIAALLVPAGLALVGLAPQTMSIDGAAVTLHLAATTLDGLGFAVLIVLTVTIPTAVIVLNGRATLERDRANRRAVRLQAWQLRQLLPRESAA